MYSGLYRADKSSPRLRKEGLILPPGEAYETNGREGEGEV